MISSQGARFLPVFSGMVPDVIQSKWLHSKRLLNKGELLFLHSLFTLSEIFLSLKFDIGQ